MDGGWVVEWMTWVSGWVIGSFSGCMDGLFSG